MVPGLLSLVAIAVCLLFRELLDEGLARSACPFGPSQSVSLARQVPKQRVDDALCLLLAPGAVALGSSASGVLAVTCSAADVWSGTRC